MSSTLSSFIRKGSQFLTPNTSSANLASSSNADGFIKAPEGALFPKVDPAIDGEDCDHDCESCTIKYPAKFSIDEEEKLYGFVKGWSTHMIVATGKTDWVRDVEDEKGSVMEAVGKCNVKPTNGRLMLSASNILVPPSHETHPKGAQPTTVLLLPSFTLIENVTPQSVPDLITHYISPASTNTTPLKPPVPKPEDLEPRAPATPESIGAHTLLTSEPPTPIPSAAFLSQLTTRPSPQ